MKRYLLVVTFIALTASVVQHRFMGLSAICVFSFVKCLLKPFVYFYKRCCFLIHES